MNVATQRTVYKKTAQGASIPDCQNYSKCALALGLWHPSKRDQSNRAWVLLILATPADPAGLLKVTRLSEVSSQLMELTDQALNEVPDPDAELPRCPHCGSCRTRLLGEYPRLGGP